MEAFEVDGWLGDLSWADSPGMARRVQMVLEASETAHRRTAARLRSCGQVDRARQAEQFAAWARFDLDEPVVAQRLYRASAKLRYVPQLERLAEQALDNVLSLARAEQGNVQLLDPASGALKIIAQHGFDAAFLDHFAVVDDDSSACGRAAGHGAQLVITDVISDLGFQPHRDIAAASGFRAVQSTPLLGWAGHVVGVVSTHYPRPYGLSARELRIVKRYADLVGRVLAARLGAVPQAGAAQVARQPVT
jgi:GAF domain-containing protein